MQVIYAREPFPKEVRKLLFFAGPTPRRREVSSWRPEGIEILRELKYDGTVYIPEPRDGNWLKDYEGQINSEEEFLEGSDRIVFWVPRVLETMPAFTTNVEYGRWYESGKCVLGAPETALHMNYLKHYARKFHRPTFTTLKETLEHAIREIGDGALRRGGACRVPLDIWRTAMFQSWYEDLKKAGNRLDDARVRFVHRAGHTGVVFFFVLWANVWIEAEKRHKENEFIVSRPDAVSVLLYRRDKNYEMSEVVLVREFRTPVRNPLGQVYELPGGSSWNPNDQPLEIAVHECEEEIGFSIDPKRLQYQGSRQAAATLLTMHNHLYIAELSESEMNAMRGKVGQVYGEDDCERTFVEVVRLRDILNGSTPVDWTTRGMILSTVRP